MYVCSRALSLNHEILECSARSFCGGATSILEMFTRSKCCAKLGGANTDPARATSVRSNISRGRETEDVCALHTYIHSKAIFSNLLSQTRGYLLITCHLFPFLVLGIQLGAFHVKQPVHHQATDAPTACQ